MPFFATPLQRKTKGPKFRVDMTIQNQCSINERNAIWDHFLDSPEFPVTPTSIEPVRSKIELAAWQYNLPTPTLSTFTSVDNNQTDLHGKVITPEGLRPRRKVDSIRKEFGLSWDAPTMEHTVGNGKKWSCIDRASAEDEIPLPPTPNRSCSWSKTQTRVGDSYLRSLSPMTSLCHQNSLFSWSNSFDNQSNRQPTAQSPHLSFGKTRTAVGAAIVAIEQQREYERLQTQQKQQNTLNSKSFVGFDASILPVNIGSEHSQTQKSSDQSRFVGFDASILPVNIGSEHSQTQKSSDQSRFVAPNIASIRSKETETDRMDDLSLNASPSSRVKEFSSKEFCNTKIQSSQYTTVTSGGTAISKTMPTLVTRKNRENEFGSTSSTNDFRGFDKYQCMDENPCRTSFANRSNFDSCDNCQMSRPLSFCDGIVPLSDQYLRKDKEQLLYSAMERLQDNIKFVTEVEEINMLSFDWDIRTQPDQYSLLTGFPSEFRAKLVRKIDYILSELNTSMLRWTVEAISPEIEENNLDLTHEDLRGSLLFWKTIVNMAVPDLEKRSPLLGSGILGKWNVNAEIRKTIGIVDTTPTSHNRQILQEKLPNYADTPVTSSESVATTLTSTFTSHRNDCEIFLNCSHGRKTNGLTIRQAITTLSTTFQKVTSLFEDLASVSLDNPISMQIINQMKSHYVTILGLQSDDLISLIDSFEYENCGYMDATLIENDPPIKLSLPTFVRDEIDTVSAISESSVDHNMAPRRRRRHAPNNANRFAPSKMKYVEEEFLSFYNSKDIASHRVNTRLPTKLKCDEMIEASHRSGNSNLHGGAKCSKSVNQTFQGKQRSLFWSKKTVIGE